MPTEIDMIFDIDAICEKLALPEFVKAEARAIFAKCEGESFNNVQIRAVTSVYAACKVLEIPRTVDDIFNASNANRYNQKSIRSMYTQMCLNDLIQPKFMCPMKMVSRIASKAGIDQKTTSKALVVLKHMQECGMSAQRPMVLAGTALYTACVILGTNKLQKEIARAAQTTEPTIGKNWKKVKAKFDKDGTFDKMWREDHPIKSEPLQVVSVPAPVPAVMEKPVVKIKQEEELEILRKAAGVPMDMEIRHIPSKPPSTFTRWMGRHAGRGNLNGELYHWIRDHPFKPEWSKVQCRDFMRSKLAPEYLVETFYLAWESWRMATNQYNHRMRKNE